MKTLIFVFMLTIAMPIDNYCQCDKYKKIKDIWISFKDYRTQLSGYKDLEGIVKVEPQFEWVEDEIFLATAVVFSKDKGWICVDRNLNFRYYPYIHGDYEVDTFKSGLRRIGKDSSIGFADMKGKIIIPQMYDYVTPFAGNYAAFYSGGKFTCNNREIPDSICEYKTWQHGLWGIINKQNDTIIAPHLPNIDGLDLSSLTDIDPGSANYVRVRGKGKDYFIEDVRKTFESYLSNFLGDARENKNNGLIKHSADFIDCQYCFQNLTGKLKRDYEAERMERINDESTAQIYIDIYPIELKDFAPAFYDSIFTDETIKTLGDPGNRRIFVFQQECSQINFALNETIPCCEDKFHFVFRVDITAPDKPFGETFQFLKTPNGIKLIHYNRQVL